jgi:hypothetical protein
MSECTVMDLPEPVAPATSKWGIFETSEKGEKANRTGLPLAGINPLREEETTHISRSIIKGQMLSPDDDGYILIGASLLKKYSAFADVDVPGLTLIDNVNKLETMVASLTSNNRSFHYNGLTVGIDFSGLDGYSLGVSDSRGAK